MVALTPAALAGLTVRVLEGARLREALPRLEDYLRREELLPLSRDPNWLTVLERGLGHRPYCLEAVSGGRTCGVLPLAYVRSLLFGRFLTGLPYLNYGGPMADDDEAASALVDRAVELADALKVKNLELRNEREIDHPELTPTACSKLHMRLEMPKGGPDALWKAIPSKARNQVRKGQKSDLTVHWGGEELLGEFHAVFSTNMRDLGTPVYGKALFRETLRAFPGRAELCVVRQGRATLAGALLLHGRGVTEVPSASSLRQYNHTCANMLMYWHLLSRAAERGQRVFDFGRCSPNSPTFRFKEQWGARPTPAAWQFYLRSGSASDVRPDNPRFRLFIALWRRLPVRLTRLLGPGIVRGIP